jgi:hypothetical protein
MSAFLDGSFGNPLPRYWWRPLDAAAFFGHADVVRFLVEEVDGVEVTRSRSRGLCAFGLPGCGRSGVEVERRLESEWTVHSAVDVARCGGHREVADLLQDLAQVESMRKGVVVKGTGAAVVDDEGAMDGSGKGAGVGVQVVELDEVEFSYRYFVLERF